MLKTSPAVKAFIAILIGFATVISTASAASALSQGDTIVLRDSPQSWGASCTVGYVDRGSGTVHTAGHCGAQGQRVYTLGGQEIGRFNTRYNNVSKRNDQGSIRVYNGTHLGTNHFSGDHIAHISTVRVGDQICSYGAKSNRQHCGHVRGIDGNIVIASPEAGGIKGDSGGPAWIPGKGFVGTYSVYWEIPGERVGTGFTPLDGHDHNTVPSQPIWGTALIYNNHIPAPANLSSVAGFNAEIARIHSEFNAFVTNPAAYISRYLPVFPAVSLPAAGTGADDVSVETAEAEVVETVEAPVVETVEAEVVETVEAEVVETVEAEVVEAPVVETVEAEVVETVEAEVVEAPVVETVEAAVETVEAEVVEAPAVETVEADVVEAAVETVEAEVADTPLAA